MSPRQDEGLRGDGTQALRGTARGADHGGDGHLRNGHIVWHGLWAPKGTPKDIVDKLNGAVVKALADSAVQKRVAALGMSIPDKAELTPKALHDFHQAEIDKWWPIIRSYGIKVQ
jgi:tripartite-type tricarboxylate transporter receptor subunit TctC